MSQPPVDRNVTPVTPVTPTTPVSPTTPLGPVPSEDLSVHDPMAIPRNPPPSYSRHSSQTRRISPSRRGSPTRVRSPTRVSSRLSSRTARRPYSTPISPRETPIRAQYIGSSYGQHYSSNRALQISHGQRVGNRFTGEVIVPGETEMRPVKMVYGSIPVGRSSVYTVCPYCDADIYTMVDYQNSWKTHVFVMLLFMCMLCLAFIVYCMLCAKDAVHYCPACGRYLGTRTI